MTRVDFYELVGERRQTIATVCQLAAKAWRQGHKVYIHAADQPQAEAIDEALWQFSPQAFVPHNLVGEGPDTPPPVQIGCAEIPSHHSDVLINLALEVPNLFSRFRRVAEIIPPQQDDREPARNRYRFYKSRGYPLQLHKLA